MIKRVKNKLPYPKDVTKEAIPDTVSSYLILRLLCTYFDHLTGVKISAEIPEMSSYLDEYLITGKISHFIVVNQIELRSNYMPKCSKKRHLWRLR